MDVAIDHPRFRTVDASIFTRRFAPDCMTHRCAVVADEHGAAVEPPRVRPDVCCQYGCDVDLAERAAILGRAAELRAVLRPEVHDLPWFDDEVIADADYPSGAVVRSAVVGGGCVFLSHDRRGCGIHRAALEGGWDLRGVKPAICRLYPLTYEADAIMIAPEYAEYSCARAEGPTLYRLGRDILADLFGAPLVDALDAAEAQVLAAAEAQAQALAAAAAASSPSADPPARRLPVV